MRYLLPVGASPRKKRGKSFFNGTLFALSLFTSWSCYKYGLMIKPLTERISNNRPLTLSPVAQDNPCDLREMMTEGCFRFTAVKFIPVGEHHAIYTWQDPRYSCGQ
jgi:hypothetical protein